MASQYKKCPTCKIGFMTHMLDDDEECGRCRSKPKKAEVLGSNSTTLLDCPFCGEVPDLPNGDGTQYEIECDCGMARSCVQISDLMTIEERMDDDFADYRYGEEYIKRAKVEAAKNWNKRAI